MNPLAEASAADSDPSNKSASASSTRSSSPGTLTPASSTASSASSSPKPSTQGNSKQVVPANGVGSSTKVGNKDAHVSVKPGSVQQPSSAAGSKTQSSTAVSQASVQGSKLPVSKAVNTHAKGEKPKRVLPDFSVNDNSRIDVVVSSHEFQTSMATNDFSASSTSASLGGSYGPISASVSYSQDSMHSSSASNTSDTYHKTMIAKYLVCTLSTLSTFVPNLYSSLGST